MQIRQEKKFAKLIAICTIYQDDPDWDAEVIEYVKEFSRALASRYGFPDGWETIASYDDAKVWFLDNCV